MGRRSRQTFIIFIYLLILSLFFGALFFAFGYQKPSCLDGKQNQNETGIDCGGKCSEYCLADLASRPLLVTEVQALAYGNSSSDALGKVRNQNSKAALQSATYTFQAYDQAGKILAEQNGQFSLLPLEERTLIALGLPVAQGSIAKTELTISKEVWVAFPDFTEAPDIRVANPQFSLLSGQTGYAEARGLVQNQSSYDIRTLSIVVVVRDASGAALSVNKTTMNTVQSGERRDFRLLWPQSFPGLPVSIDTQVHFDMLAEDAFVEQYFPGGKFQSLSPGR